MIDIHLTVRLVPVSRGTAEPTRLRDPAELRRLEFRILHAARPHEEVQRDDRRSGEQRLGAGTERRKDGIGKSISHGRSKCRRHAFL